MGGGPIERVLVINSAPKPKIFTELENEFPSINFTYYQIELQGGIRTTRIPKELYQDITILVTFSDLPPTLEDAPHLKLIHFFSAGTNHVANHPIYKDSDITLTTSSGIHGPQIAEWVILTALAHTHRYNFLYEAQKRKQWAAKEYRKEGVVHDLVNRRIGILGYGSIGRQVGRVAKALGLDVLAYTATPKTTPEARKDKGFIVPGTGDPEGEIPSAWYNGFDKESLHHFLKQDLDQLLIAVPLTKETQGLLSTEEFEILGSQGKTPLLSNIARGPIIDTDALIDALHTGKLGGAALDVTDPEPLPSDHPLWTAPNVHISPHISSTTDVYTERSLQVLQQNLRRLVRGESLLNVVDRRRGY